MESLNIKIKAILSSSSVDSRVISEDIAKLQDKLSKMNTKFNVDLTDIDKLNKSIQLSKIKINNSVDGIKQQDNAPLNDNNKYVSDNEEKINKLLYSLGFMGISKNLLNLTFTLFAFTKYSEIYENIKNDPVQFKALLERLPIESQYTESNNYIYKGKALEAESVIPLVASLDLLKSIRTEELMSFHRFVTTTPLLGLHHKIGIKIFNYINGLEKRCLKRKLNLKLYHGRKREVNGKPLNILELFEAPYSIASHGRANMIGIPALYFSNDPHTVVLESRWKEGENILDGFESKINRTFTMLDISDNTCELFSYCYFPHKSANDLSAYIVPNFIADCCRLKKIDGMIYKSVQNNESMNYVFFYPDKSWFKKIKYFYWDGKLNWA